MRSSSRLPIKVCSTACSAIQFRDSSLQFPSLDFRVNPDNDDEDNEEDEYGRPSRHDYPGKVIKPTARVIYVRFRKAHPRPASPENGNGNRNQEGVRLP